MRTWTDLPRLRARLVVVIVFAIVWGLVPAGALAQTGLSAVLTGHVRDATTQGPVSHAVVTVSGRSAITDEDGAFLIPHVPTGSHALDVHHVGYEPWSRIEVVTAGTHHVSVSLTPHYFSFDAEDVHADRTRTTVTTMRDRTGYRIRQEDLRDLPIDDVTESLELLAGVVVSNERLYFRGLSYEQVTPLIDGFSAREPIRGQWILPPPDAIRRTDLITGEFSAAYGGVGGVLDMALTTGTEKSDVRVVYRTDELSLVESESFNWMDAQLTASGPMTDRLRYAVSWRGELTDTHMAYDIGRPTQEIVGTAPLLDRMRGNQNGAVKLTYRPERSPWVVSTSVVHASSRTKRYHHHYSRSGDVWFDWLGDRKQYRRYLFADESEDDPFISNVERYEGPRGVPIERLNSTLVLSRFRGSMGTRGVLSTGLRVAVHDMGTRVGGEGDAEMLTATRYTRQDETYWATHGTYPDFADGRSYEIGLDLDTSWTIGAHRLRAGAGGNWGRHRFLTITPLLQGFQTVGSDDDWMRTFDGHVFIEDRWNLDPLSEFVTGIRLDNRRIWAYPGSGSGTRVSPRLGFHHPATDRSAIHVNAGLLYSFPGLHRHFGRALADEFDEAPTGVTVVAQRTRGAEVGLQHHFSRRVVGYVTGYVRSNSEVRFTDRYAGETGFFSPNPGAVATAPGFEIDTVGLEATVDVRPLDNLQVSTSVTALRVTAGNNVVPSDRNLTFHGWTIYRPIPGITLSGRWNASLGEPYRACLLAGCDHTTDEHGRLPFELNSDLRFTFAPHRGSRVNAFAEVRNVLNRRVPTFAFSTYPINSIAGRTDPITGHNFLNYYLLTDETGGYATRNLDGTFDLHEVDNPQTRSAGRSLRAGITLQWK